MAENSSIQQKKQFGLTTQSLVGICHNCGICAYANKKPESAFGRLMNWHRNWRPAWAAHTKVYGLKQL